MNERKKIERHRAELAGKDATTQLLWQLLASKQQEEIEHHELLIRLLSLSVISTLTSSTTGAQQKVDPKNDCVKPMKVYY